jgi:adenine-specific DNA-methyltransferase
MEALNVVADMEPRRVLMLDRNLDDSTKLNAVQIFRRVEEKTGREVELRTV